MARRVWPDDLACLWLCRRKLLDQKISLQRVTLTFMRSNLLCFFLLAVSNLTEALFGVGSNSGDGAP